MISSPTPRTFDPALTPLAFSYETGTFAFANETVWNYVDGKVAAVPDKKDHGKRLYTRRCFVVSRAAVQFWKFARFDAVAKPLAEEELARRIRRVTKRSVWKSPLPVNEKIVFPGYATLREISAAHVGVFQAHIGLGWPIYFRMGNFPIILPMNAPARSRVNAEIHADLQAGYPTILWLYNFPKLDINHAVVVFDAEQQGDRIHYRVYDPNYIDGPKHLEFDLTNQLFTYQPTFYFKGGPVTARPVYRGYFE